MPDQFLDFPDVGSLRYKGGAVDLAKIRKPIPIVFAAEPEKNFVLIDTQKLTDNFHGQDFTIFECWLRPSLSQTLALQNIHQRIIDNTLRSKIC